MTDVYARAGIPMPPNPDKDKTIDEKVEELINAEPNNAEPNIDWQKRAEEEQDRQLRLECLKMVQNAPVNSRIREAEKLFKYLKSGPDASMGLFTFACGTCLWNWTAGHQEHGEDALAQHFSDNHPALYKSIYGRDSAKV